MTLSPDNVSDTLRTCDRRGSAVPWIISSGISMAKRLDALYNFPAAQNVIRGNLPSRWPDKVGLLD